MVYKTYGLCPYGAYSLEGKKKVNTRNTLKIPLGATNETNQSIEKKIIGAGKP